VARAPGRARQVRPFYVRRDSVMWYITYRPILRTDRTGLTTSLTTDLLWAAL